MVQNVFAQVLNWACEHGQQWNLCQHWENWSSRRMGHCIDLVWISTVYSSGDLFLWHGFIEKWIIRTFGAKHREAWFSSRSVVTDRSLADDTCRCMLPSSSQKHKECTKAVIYYLTKDMLPISTANKAGFKGSAAYILLQAGFLPL